MVRSGAGSTAASDDWSAYPLVRKASPSLPDGRVGGNAANIAAGANEALAGFAGAPLDLMTGGVNALLRLPSAGEPLATPTPLPMPGHFGMSGSPNVARINPAMGAAAEGAAISPPQTSVSAEPIQIINPVGGSESIKSLMGLIGADPRNVVPENDIQKLERGTAG